MQERYVMEARHPDGSLNVKADFPPITEGTMDDFFRYYFKQHPDKERASQETRTDYFKSKGWYIRPKYW